MGLKWEKSVNMQACKEYMIRALQQFRLVRKKLTEVQHKKITKKKNCW